MHNFQIDLTWFAQGKDDEVRVQQIDRALDHGTEHMIFIEVRALLRVITLCSIVADVNKD